MTDNKLDANRKENAPSQNNITRIRTGIHNETCEEFLIIENDSSLRSVLLNSKEANFILRLSTELVSASSKSVSNNSIVSEVEIPKWSNFVVYLFIPKCDRDSLIGDLREEYLTVLVPKYGIKAALFWYRFQVLRSLFPYLKRGIIKLITLGWLAKSADGILKKFLG